MATDETRVAAPSAGGVPAAHPDDVSLQRALEALADPVRRSLLRQLAAAPEWTLRCGEFDLGVSKATSSHHFAVLRAAGLLEQRDAGTRRLNRLRREEFQARFPGLLELVLADPGPAPSQTPSSKITGPAPGRGL